MLEDPQTSPMRSITFSSSLKDEIWHDQSGANAFETWHFDALSDDGREALVITFHDNYPLSPRYFREHRNTNGNDVQGRKRFPAVSFTYSVGGKVVLRSVNEFAAGEFSSKKDDINCSIGASSFRVDEAEYGSGYLLQIDLLTARKRRIKAELEWLSIEADLSAGPAETGGGNSFWNLAAPRSDVTGRITLVGRRGKTRKMVHFRGTGYHDHFRSEDSFVQAMGSRCWGRAHFIDSTAIFQHSGRGEDNANIFLVRDGLIHERTVKSEMQNPAWDRYGVKIPRRLSFISDDNIRLRVKPVKVIQAGFFETKLLSEMNLTLRDGKPRKTFGIAEFITAVRMKSPVLRWLSDLRIGKNGRSPLI